MKTKHLKQALTTIGAIGLSLLPVTPTFADTCSADVPVKVRQAAGCMGNTNDLPVVIQNILSIVIGVCGLVAVVYIIIGGYNYMTSSGDSAKIEKAKKTITYAVIGLIVCALAFVIVNFVINTVRSA